MPDGCDDAEPLAAHGLDPGLKAVRAANYLRTLRRDLRNVSVACGVAHPGLLTTDDLDVLSGHNVATVDAGGVWLREGMGTGLGG